MNKITMEKMTVAEMNQLKKRIHFRKVKVKSCATCDFAYWKEGTIFCSEFPVAVNFDAGDRSEYHYICNLWKLCLK